MAWAFVPGGGSPWPPADPARSIEPHERSKMMALALREWRCGRGGCDAGADHTSLRPSGEVHCTLGHPGHIAVAFNSVLRRALGKRK